MNDVAIADALGATTQRLIDTLANNGGDDASSQVLDLPGVLTAAAARGHALVSVAVETIDTVAAALIERRRRRRARRPRRPMTYALVQLLLAQVNGAVAIANAWATDDDDDDDADRITLAVTQWMGRLRDELVEQVKRAHARALEARRAAAIGLDRVRALAIL